MRRSVVRLGEEGGGEGRVVVVEESQKRGCCVRGVVGRGRNGGKEKVARNRVR